LRYAGPFRLISEAGRCANARRAVRTSRGAIASRSCAGRRGGRTDGRSVAIRGNASANRRASSERRSVPNRGRSGVAGGMADADADMSERRRNRENQRGSQKDLLHLSTSMKVAKTVAFPGPQLLAGMLCAFRATEYNIFAAPLRL
jgi:hypothetical protein